MSFIDQITVLILTYNEEPNIGRSLDAVRRFRSVVVLDSGSTDQTLDIVKRYENARLVTRPFDAHATQWNFGLTDCGIRTPWILALDSDYILPSPLVDEIAGLSPGPDISGYRTSFNYCVFGRALPGTLYPPVQVLFRREGASYFQAGHTQRLQLAGKIADLSERIEHDDRKPVSRWFKSQQGYAKLEAEFVLNAPRPSLRRTDKIRRLGWPAPILVFFYTLIFKRCILCGWHGWFYVLQRTTAEAMIALEVVDRRLRRSADNVL